MNPQFSVIIPIYNVEKYLHQCVNSVLNQTFRDLELILVDDGSTDSSLTICDEYASKYKQIIVLHKINGGQSDARNYGLTHAKGDYILFIDSDDYLKDENVLEKIAAKTINNPDVILYKFEKFYEDTGEFSGSRFEFPLWNSTMTTAQKLQLLVDSDAYYNSAWSKTIKRTILVNNHIYFEKGLLGEDNDWYYNVVLNAKSYEYIDEIFYVYRQRSGSTTQTCTIKNLTDLNYILQKWTDIIKNSNIDESLKSVLYGSLAKQYSHALIMYQNLSDSKKNNFKKELRNLSYLLKYSGNKRVVITRRVYSIIGFDGTIQFFKLASFLLKIKRSLKNG